MQQSETLRNGAMPEKLMTNEELAELLDMPLGTVRRWPSEGTGPKSIRIGRRVRWRPEDVRAWLDELAKVA